MPSFFSPRSLANPPTEGEAPVEKPTPQNPLVRSLFEIPDPLDEDSNPDALFRNGWGRRGHFALLNATSGVGKSVISLQTAYSWALGKPGLIGSAPIKPLKIGIIQAEDDDTEMSEFRRNHRLGFKSEGWTEEQLTDAEKKILDFSLLFKGVTGDDFAAKLSEVLTDYPVDVVVLNPLQSYTAFDIAKNEFLSKWLRQQIQPVLETRKCLMLCVHHTNKPPSAQDRGEWGMDMMAAYIGAGGAELVNFARSVTVIMPDKKAGAKGYFQIFGAKRGNRLGWTDFNGEKTTRRYIAYSDDCIHWRVPTEEELIEKGLITNSASVTKVLDEKASAAIEEEAKAAASRVAAAVRAAGKPIRGKELTQLADGIAGRRLRDAVVKLVANQPKEYGLVRREGAARGRTYYELYAYGAGVKNEFDKMKV